MTETSTMKRCSAETTAYVLCTLMTLGGVSLCVSGLCVPYWVETSYVTGIVVTQVFQGPWLDRLCVGIDPCQDMWRWGSQERHPETRLFSDEVVTNLETSAVGVAMTSLLALLAVWLAHRDVVRITGPAHLVYVATSAVAGCLALAGVVVFIVSSQHQVRSWGHFLCGGGACLLLAAGGAAGLTYILTHRQHGGETSQRKPAPFKFNKMVDA